MNSHTDKQAVAQESRFNGSTRWIYTVAATLAIPAAFALAHRLPAFAVFVVITFIINGLFAVSEWRKWLQKSEAEKAPLRFLPQLEIKDISIPAKRDEFIQARRAARLNLSIAAIALIYFFCGILSVVSLLNPHLHKSGLQIVFIVVGIVAAWIAWHCGKRFLRAAKMLTCPGCKDLLTSQAISVLETGRCRKCGRTILIDSNQSL